MKFFPNFLRKSSIVVQIGVPVGVLALALELKVSASDTLLGTVLGAYLAYIVQQRTESKIHKSQFHTDLIEQVLAPLYTEVHTKKEAFRRMNEEGEEVPLSVSTIRSISSNWL
jgi:metal-dependent HD superfamily phosphatase/phosphodiesterase